MLNATCTNEQKVRVTIAPVTPGGSPAQVDGGLQAEVVSGDGSFVQDPTNPLSGHVISGAGIGLTVFRIFADADLGAGVVLLEDTINLDVTGAQAVSLGVLLGTPEPK